MSDKYEQAIQDRYEASYAKGCRLGRIEMSRLCIVHSVKKLGKPSKRLIQKINREVDSRILLHIMNLLWNHSVSVEMLEDIYDTLTPPKKDFEYYDSDDP